MMNITLPTYKIKALDSEKVKDINHQLTEDSKKEIGEIRFAFARCCDDVATQILLVGEKNFALLDKV